MIDVVHFEVEIGREMTEITVPGKVDDPVLKESDGESVMGDREPFVSVPGPEKYQRRAGDPGVDLAVFCIDPPVA